MFWLATLAFLATSGLADEGFQPLVVGDDPAQFQRVDLPSDAMTILDGEVFLPGKVPGYFATKTTYQDYILEFEFQYDRPKSLKSDDAFAGNSGLLVNIQGPPKVWPLCFEFQLANAEIGNIYGVSGGTLEGKADLQASRKATKPVGQWNLAKMTSQAGRYVFSLNGVEIARGTKPNPEKGAIGFQSEGFPIRFRAMRIKTLDGK